MPIQLQMWFNVWWLKWIRVNWRGRFTSEIKTSYQKRVIIRIENHPCKAGLDEQVIAGYWEAKAVVQRQCWLGSETK